MRRAHAVSEARRRRARFAVVLLTVFLLGAVYGTLAMKWGICPGPQLERAATGLAAWTEFVVANRMGGTGVDHAGLFRSGRYQRPRYGREGVTTHTTARALEGYTLYTSAHDQAARLVDMNGRIAHEWKRSFSEVWPDPQHLRPMPVVAPDFIMWRHAHLFPGGEILVVFEAVGTTPWGYGLAKLDKDSNVMWKFDAHAHHDADVAPDGRIVTLTQRLRHDKIAGVTHMKTPMVEDFVVVLSPDGISESSHSLYEMLAAPGWRHFLETVPDSAKGDYLHPNTVAFVPEQYAAANPGVKAGDVMVTCRAADLVLVMRPETGEVVWATRLPVRMPHDAQPLANGNIIIFDNRGRRSGPAPGSQVLEFNPRTRALAWAYAGPTGELLDSPVRSSVQVLRNGNVLITESDAGRLLEVTRQGELVWEFLSPHRTKLGNRTGLPIMCAGTRFTPDEVAFLRPRR